MDVRCWLSVTIAAAALATISCGGTGGETGAPADLVLENGRIVTVDEDLPEAEAVAIRDGRFVAVGTSADVGALTGPSTRVIDLGGRTVVPGLADGHLHGAGGGPGVDLSRTRSLDEVLQAIRDAAGATPAGELIVTNSDWHEAQLREQRLPLRRDLDAAAPDHAVVVVRGGHEYILNSAALRRWSIDERTPVPEGGMISRYDDGSLNGELVDTAKALVTLPPPPERTVEEELQDLVAEHRTLNAAGLTSIRYPGTSVEEYRLLEELRRRGQLSMRVSVLLRPGRQAGPEEVGRWLEESGLRPDEGDEWVRVGGVKLGVDGGFEGGLMREPYLEPMGAGGTYRGLQTVPRDRFVETVKLLNRLGWRVGTHAVGDAAIDLVLDGYEAADAESSIAGKRWALEHGFIPAEEHFPRMARLGLVISAQNHLFVAGPSLVRYWGPERAGWTTPVRAYLDHGLVVAGGTDSPVIPYPPLWVVSHFVTRDTISGGVLGPDQRISRDEALRVSTIHNAYLTFEEGLKGSITVGKLGDAVVLSDDIMTCAPEAIGRTEVVLTVVGGRVVYEHPSTRLPSRAGGYSQAPAEPIS